MNGRLHFGFVLRMARPGRQDGAAIVTRKVLHRGAHFGLVPVRLADHGLGVVGQRRLWRIPTTKTGKARHVPLSDGVISLLSAMPRDKCDWTFPNPDTGKPYVSIFWAWDSARTKADLADVRIHDLRHSHASFLVNAGRTLYEVQHILGHTQVKTTQRYAHLSHDTLLAATNSVNTALGGMFMPMVSAGPVEIGLIR